MPSTFRLSVLGAQIKIGSIILVRFAPSLQEYEVVYIFA